MPTVFRNALYQLSAILLAVDIALFCIMITGGV